MGWFSKAAKSATQKTHQTTHHGAGGRRLVRITDATGRVMDTRRVTTAELQRLGREAREKGFTVQF